MPAVGAHALPYLRRKLAGRDQDECANGVPCGRIAGVGPGREPLQERQRKACSLSGAGLGRAEQVASREYDRDRLRLYGSGGVVTLLGDSTEQLSREAEIGKINTNDYLLRIDLGGREPSKPVQADANSGWVIRQSGMDRETTETLTG